jgi:hypothetical protein
MDITGAASLTIQANTLDAVVILQLSTAAQQLMQGGGSGSHPSK